MIKVGVVGLGVMGQHHTRLYSQLGCDLVGVADTDSQKAKETGEKYKVPYYSDYRELLSRVEAVSIAVPTILHHRVAMDFLREGVHCLVEKPVSFSIDEAEEMNHTALISHVNLAVGHIERFNPAVVKLKQILDEGVLGKVLIVNTRRVGPFVPRIMDVGIVIDSAIHDIGVVKYLVGKNPASLFSRVGSLRHPREDHAVIVMDFEDAMACIEVNWFSPQKERTLVVTGSEGTAHLDYIQQGLRIHTSGEGEAVEIQKGEPLRLEIEDFLRSIAGGVRPAVDGYEGQEILKLALESSRNNYYTARLVLHRSPVSLVENKTAVVTNVSK